MGISGLLKSISSLNKKKHVSEYSGKTIAIDAYVWYHSFTIGFIKQFIVIKKNFSLIKTQANL
jgi:hypothetical protein